MNMNKLLGFALLGCVIATAACEQEGPAERAGERVDQAVDDLRDGAQDVGDEIKDTADEVGDKLDQADE